MIGKLSIGLAIGVVVLLPGPAAAIAIDVTPAATVVAPGGAFDVDLVISGLGDLSAPSLGYFGINVNFDGSLIAFVAAAYHDGLNLGNPADSGSTDPNDPIFTNDLLGPGFVRLTEVTGVMEVVLDAGQPGSFSLVTLSFVSLGPTGSTPLSLSYGPFDMGDAGFDPYVVGQITLNDASVQIVPEPAAGISIGLGLVAIAAFRRRVDRP